MRYYIDTNIWIDIFENRIGFRGEPLGEHGAKFLFSVISSGGKIVLSNVSSKELGNLCSFEEINGLLAPFLCVLENAQLSYSQDDEAQHISQTRNVPLADAQHAVLARDNRCILVTRDVHFRKLRDIVESYRPEDLSL